jgi:hypothetical protein
VALPGVSDGGAHTKFVTTARYPTEMLGYWVRATPCPTICATSSKVVTPFTMVRSYPTAFAAALASQRRLQDRRP